MSSRAALACLVVALAGPALEQAAAADRVEEAIAEVLGPGTLEPSADRWS